MSNTLEISPLSDAYKCLQTRTSRAPKHCWTNANNSRWMLPGVQSSYHNLDIHKLEIMSSATYRDPLIGPLYTLQRLFEGIRCYHSACAHSHKSQDGTWRLLFFQVTASMEMSACLQASVIKNEEAIFRKLWNKREITLLLRRAYGFRTIITL